MKSERTKSLLVTGAAGGLGSALSKVAAIGGWRVVMIDKDKRGLESAYDAIISAGGIEPYLQTVDLATIGPDDCQQVADALQEKLGCLDALVHCAVAFKGLQPLDLIEPEIWLQQLQVNLNVPWLLSIKLMPLLKLGLPSSLIFILDKQADSKPLWGTYGLSKAATRALVAQFESELRSSGVRVHGIDPGPMRTSLRSSVYHSENPNDLIAPEVRARQLLSILEQSARAGECFIDLYNRIE
jgi:NAD(P)-dependent dehydrogenase (short-subunit alcohol dehydrogenase family)